MYTILITSFIFPFLIFIKNEKLQRIINKILILIITSVIILNRQNNDYEAYELIFLNPDGYAEIGYVYLINILKILNFNGHQSVLLILGLLFFYTFNKLSYDIKYLYVCLLAYFVFLLPVDITQVRNTFVSLFFINCLYHFSKKKYLLGLVFLALCLSFHIYSFILLILLILNNIRFTKKNIYLKIIIFCLFCTASFEFIILFLEKYSESLRTLEHYFSARIKIESLIIWILPLLSIILILKKVQKNFYYYDDNFFNILITISILSLFFMSGLLYLQEFNRLYRLIFLLLLICSCIIMRILKFKERIYLSFYLFAISVAYAFYYNSRLNYDYILWGFT